MENADTHLIRLQSTPDGTFGVLVTCGLSYPTLEPFEPIIPVGNYICAWSFMPTPQVHHYEIKEVPGHTGVFIHAFNFANETSGCVGLGKSIGLIGDRLGILDSGRAVSMFDSVMGRRPFTLFVHDALKIVTASGNFVKHCEECHI